MDTGYPRLILFSSAILVTMPEDAGAADAVFSAAWDAMYQTAERAAAEIPGGVPTGVVSFHYPGQEGENALPCGRCGRWASDLGEPDPIDGIASGEREGDRFLCIQCRDWEAGLR